MKILLFVIILVSSVSALFAAGTVNVRGYTRKDGTYVAPHTRAAPGTASKTTPSYTESSAPSVNKSSESIASTPAASSTTQSSQSPASVPAKTEEKKYEPVPAATNNPPVLPIRSIHVGMTENEVRDTMGTSPNLCTKTRWLYSGVGTIIFGSDRKVSEVIVR